MKLNIERLRELHQEGHGLFLSGRGDGEAPINYLGLILAYIESLEKKVEAGEELYRDSKEAYNAYTNGDGVDEVSLGEALATYRKQAEPNAIKNEDGSFTPTRDVKEGDAIIYRKQVEL
jgi:hypothetical protein